MTDGAVEPTVEELLAAAAVATEANAAPKAKKPRTPKLDAEGNAVVKPPRAPKLYAQVNADGTPILDEAGNPVMGEGKPTKAPKEAKLYPQAAEDGTPALFDTGEPVMGPYLTRYKEPKAAKAPRLDADGNPIVRQSNVFPLDAKLFKVEGKGTGYREGSKRKQNFDLIPAEGITVGDYYAAGGGKSVVHTFAVWYVNEDESVRIEVGEPAAE